MTQEEKELVLKDLCARIPYGVRVKLNGRRETSNKLTIDWLYTYSKHIEDIKPYLRPMSSMTDEEFKELQDSYWCGSGINQYTEFGCIDLLNSHHFDYRGLIPMDLALEAPEGMYNT